MKLILIALLFVVYPFSLIQVDASWAQQPTSAQLVKTDTGWSLVRDGKPYYINGVGCDGSLGDLAKTGANSVRTWDTKDFTQKLLDDCHAQGISVSMGIWLGHERHGTNYQNFDEMAEQIDSAMKTVRRFKDHPAVLLWGVGNEMEGGEGSNPAIWSHIEHIASLIKKEDPNHPVMTVIAEIGGRKVEGIHKFCPSVDIIGINSYGGAPSVSKRYSELNGTKPYIITEYGPVGTWEVPKNSIGAIEEPLIQEKAKHYAQSYKAFKADASCLGSYAFLWGHKQEATATWFGMLLPSNNRTAIVDTMTELWTGEKPANLCPEIKSLTFEGSNSVKQNQLVRFKLDAFDPETDPLHVKWVLSAESSSYVTGGDVQAAPEEFKEQIVSADKTSAEIKMPESGGMYRVYAYVDDGKGGGAAANIPIHVEGNVKMRPAQKSDLPFVVYEDTFDNAPYAASGFMGSAEAISLDPRCADNPKTGTHCLKISYKREDAWGGVVWQSPANDWGDLDGGYNISGAKTFKFWARGDKGNETIKFGVGLLGRDKKYFDTTQKEVVITLTDQWQQITVDLKDADLRRIKTGFFFSVEGQGQPLEFFVDGIRFE
ncbi:MAG: glycoside hydrolase family 2 TIM barrel-domain containing protein [Mariniblastus sp.]|nr:glycoside hydrolase family 2 TIM barrel-domain containing protein [Mariniblastus sp.]